mgnify:CR=1 FL=1
MKQIEFKGKYIEDVDGGVTTEPMVKDVSHLVIKSWSCDYKTHKPYGVGFELVDLDRNILYSNCHDVWDCEDNYEMFWNRLNEISSGWRGSEIVKVIKVYSLEDFMNEYDTPTKKQELIDTMTHKSYIDDIHNIWNKGKSILEENTLESKVV